MATKLRIKEAKKVFAKKSFALKRKLKLFSP